MPIEKLDFNGVESTENLLTLTKYKLNEIIEFINKLFTFADIKFQGQPICTYGRCECEHCKLLLRAYKNVLEKYNSLLQENQKCQ